MKKIKWVLFDVGGVLLDWQKSSDNLAKQLGVGKEELLESLFRHAEQMNIGKISPIKGWGHVLKELNVKEDPETVIRRWRSAEFWLSDSLKLIGELQERGYKIGLFTNSWLGLSEQKDKNNFPTEIARVDYIFDSSREGLRKPEGRFYDLVIKTLGVPGDKIYFIDDDIKNLEPAMHRGWQVFHYRLGKDNGKLSNKKIREELISPTS